MYESKEILQALGVLRAGMEKLGTTQPTVEQMRAFIDANGAAMPLPPGVAYREVSEEGVRGIWARPDRSSNQRAIFYTHGGGYMIGSAAGYKSLTGEIARLTQTPVFSLDYRLAPENPYPAAIDDALAGYRYLLKTFAPSSIAFAGDSAGGAMAVATMLRARSEGLPLPGASFLISPWLDHTLTCGTMTSKADVELLASPDALRGFTAAYISGTKGDVRDPLVSPLFGELGGLPPMVIQVGSEETLLDDSVNFASKAGAAGVKVQLEITPGAFHVFHNFYALVPEAREALANAAHFLTAHLV